MISGVGLLLLTITNRLGRSVDRIRFLVTELDHENVKRREEKQNEIKILYKRSRFLRNSIGWLVVSVISNCTIIPILFVMNFSTLNLSMVVYGLFVVSITSLFVSSIYFFRDILIGLHAVKLEAKDFV
jgi:hypothetical protein